MDDEAKQLLREIRDIALRNEQKLIKDFLFRRIVFIMAGIGLLMAIGIMVWLTAKTAPLIDEELERSAPAAHGNLS
ncbi:MAG: hypothetical protein EXS05_06440 [Planctomycetaceae bacterium]|nr:hypothetical protein [Planctomycetaceae bacterium]